MAGFQVIIYGRFWVIPEDCVISAYWTRRMQVRFPLVRENVGSARPRFVQTRQCTRDNSTLGEIVSNNLVPA